MCGDRALADAIVNVLLFLPLGVALGVARAKRTARWLVPLTLSIGIEVAQVVIPGRFSTLSDIVTNTLGGVLGTGFAAAWRWWLLPAAATRRLWLGSGLAAATVALTAVLLRPRSGPEANFAHFVPRFENLERWQGELRTVRIAGSSVSPGWLGDTSTLVRALAGGAALTLELVPSGTSHGLAPVFALTDPQRGINAEVLALGDAFLWRQRDNAAALRLESAATRFERLGSALPPDVAVGLTITREAQRRCLVIQGQDPRCVSFPGIGAAWRLLYAPDAWSVGRRRVLDLASLGLLLLPAALAAPAASGRSQILAAALVIATASAAQFLGPLSRPGLAELTVAAATFGFVRLLRNRAVSEKQLPAAPTSD